MNATHNMGKCSQCLDCVTYCSGKALSYHEGVFTYSPDNCTLCEICMDVCDSEAIMVKG